MRLHSAQSTTPITLLVADDHLLIRAGIAAMIATEPALELIAEAVNGEEAFEAFLRARPDVVLMDLHMPVMNGIDATAAIVDEAPDATIVMLTTFEDDADIQHALDAGAKAVLLKDRIRVEIVDVVRAALAAQRRALPSTGTTMDERSPRAALTPRELEVLRFVAQGSNAGEIGRRIGRDESVVAVHLANVIRKLGARSASDAATIARQRGLF